MRRILLMVLRATALVVLMAASLAGCQHTATPPVDPNAVITSPADTFSYRYLTLDNGLRVVLASDPKADKAAASLMVGVGSTADPKGREGLAHFLEHMLFISTDKYPKVDEYMHFIEANGGSTNAYTAQTKTDFFFDVAPDKFAPALDRFAQFFIAPTLDPQYVDREKHAVYSEYQLKKKDDGRRINAVLNATGNPANPAARFAVGDLDTLADRQGDKVWSDLKAFHDRYYHAGNMTLALVGKDSLDDLEKLARQTFTAIPAGPANPVRITEAPFMPSQLGVRIDIAPLKDFRSLMLRFPVPSSQPYYLEKPLDYIASMLSNAAPGSLYTTLKESGWIDSMSAYQDGPDDYQLFSINFNLTEQGAKHVDDITAATFAYLHKLQREGVSDDFFNELKKAGNLDFRFQDKANSQALANYLAGNMQEVAPAHLMDAGFVYQTYNPALIHDYLSRLTPSNLRQVVILPGVKTDKVEPHYQAPYAIKALSPELKDSWAKAEAELALPPANPYLPDDPKVKAIKGDATLPAEIVKEPGISVWALQDPQFRVPKAEKRVALMRPIDNIQDSVMNSLYADLVNEALESEAYPASQAGLYYNLSAISNGLIYSLSGYDEKQPLLEDKIWTALALSDLSRSKFRQYRDQMVRQLRNFSQDWPVRQLFASLNASMVKEAYPPAERADALSRVNYRQFMGFVQHYRDQLYLQALAIGNISPGEAASWGKSMENMLVRDAQRIDKPQTHYANIPAGAELARQLTIDHHDSALVMIYQGHHTDAAAKARWALLGQVIGQPFFAKLRTEQQLGYVVQAGASSVGLSPVLQFIIQSPVADPYSLKGHVEDFLTQFGIELAGMSPEQFEEQKAGLINSINEADKQLGDKTNRYWSYLNNDRPFDWREQLVAAVKALQLGDMLAFYQRDIVHNGAGRYLLWSQGQQPATGEMPKACDSQACLDRQWQYQAQ
ncbi:MAG: insulinase family protein [Pseudomonadota bacterium]|uniref:insulinase family protein n=1 Tax=Gallaecimonas pentaromativorans TaxID=584787 RepID=UPI0018DD708B|nr:insulinase family protein [Gallaecimonas pentaromativorans]MED5525654.1 insulinase family protein [Pseudomonadota bacterium]